MEGYMDAIYSEINKEYGEVREQNKKKQEEIIARIYKEIPRIKEIDEQISKVALGVAADVLRGNTKKKCVASEIFKH